MRVLLTILVATLTTVSAAAWGQSTLDHPVGEDVVLARDTGLKSNLGNAAEVVHQEFVHVKNAAWLRIYFGPGTVLGRDSRVRVTSLLDNETQELDLAGLAMWSYSTAYFNGDLLLVELIAGPMTTQNRLVLDRVAGEIGVFHTIGALCGTCGIDDRVLSDEEWSGRLMPSGCTASVYNQESCLVSAGHCMTGGMVMQFRVPLSSPSCTLNQPSVQDQFPVTGFDSFNGGPGQDWAVMTSGSNSSGQTMFQRYGQFRPLATTPPQTNDSLTIWGYGTDTECTVSQVQQTSNGIVSGWSGLFFNHTVDATPGNSGSAVIRNGEILGIATHCPCPNVATRIDHPFFAAAREEVCIVPTGGCCFPDGSCDTVSVVQCSDGGGVYLGDDASCEPNECPQPEGACCLQDDSCVFAEQELCGLAGGTYQGDDVACDDAVCGAVECPADLDGDNEVGFQDLLDVLSNWGPCPGCPQDIDDDDEVAFSDLLIILSNWGPCP